MEKKERGTGGQREREGGELGEGCLQLGSLDPPVKEGVEGRIG